jgi:alpha-galactosidase
MLLLGYSATGVSLHAQQTNLRVRVNPDGSYSIGLPNSTTFALTAGVAAEVDGHWLHSGDYPRHDVKSSTAQGYLGEAEGYQVTWTGLNGEPDLICHLRAYLGKPFADVQATVHNDTGRSIHVQSIRAMEASGGITPDLGGPASEDRVLLDSFSEDRPAMKIHDLADAKNQMLRAVGSQLIYNQQSHQSLFLGALTSDRFVTIFRLHAKDSSGVPQVSAWEADSTGTTEMQLENSLESSSEQDRIQLSLPVNPGADLSSEQLALSVGTDYHQQLESYGALIREIHHARVSAPPLMG